MIRHIFHSDFLPSFSACSPCLQILGISSSLMVMKHLNSGTDVHIEHKTKNAECRYKLTDKECCFLYAIVYARRFSSGSDTVALNTVSYQVDYSVTLFLVNPSISRHFQCATFRALLSGIISRYLSGYLSVQCL